MGALLDPHAATVQRDMTVRETVQFARRAPQLLRRYVYVLDDRQPLVAGFFSFLGIATLMMGML